MSSDGHRTRQIPSLDPLEDRLSESIREVNIIDELSLDEDLRSQLRRAFDYYLQKRSLAGLIRSYPACFAVHLVAEGIYGYESGNYWGGTPLDEHKSMDDRREGGQFFETFVEVNGLETFPDRSRRYVSLILLHGSIPNDALPDFFEYALYPAVHDPDWMRFGPRELVRRWPEEGTSKYRLSKTAHTFFREGGEVAVDFVARCLEMAERTTEEGQTPSAKEVRLPERVVRFYSDWWDNYQEEKRRSRTGRSRTRRGSSKPPQIWLNPGRAQVMIDLSEQRFSSGDRGKRDSEWQIQVQSRTDVEDVRIDTHWVKSEEGWHTGAEAVPLPVPARSYNVSLTNTSRSWTLEGLDPGGQLLVFDGDTFELLSSPQALPAKPLWLLYPSQKSIEVNGGHKLEVERSLHGPWEEFTMSFWDLSSAGSVAVGDAEWTVVKQGQGLQPRLMGGQQLPLGDNRDRYYTQLPKIQIPVPPDREATEELSQWELRESSEAERPSTRPFQSDEVEVRLKEHALVLPLNRVVEQIGTYEVGVRGPMGRSATFSFFYVPNCSLYLPDEPRLPDEEGHYSEETGMLRTPPGVRLNSPRDDVEIRSANGEVHEIVFGESCVQTNVELYSPEVGSSVSLPLVAPGLQWAAKGDEWERTWSTLPLHYATDQIEQASNAELIAQSRPSSNPIEIQGTLQVRSPQEVLQRIESKSRAAGRLRFDIRESLDLLREAGRALQLRLVLGEGRAVTVGRIETTLKVRRLELITERSSDGERWDIRMSWKTAGNPVRNRCLRLWSLGRPWEPPHTFRIPDEARGETRFEESISELPPGPYLAALELEDPWKEQIPERPSRDDSNTVVVEVGSGAERLKHFWEQGDSPDAKLEQAFLAEKPSEAARLFREATRGLGPSDVSTLLRALWWLGTDESLVDQVADNQSVAHWIRKEVLRHPEVLVSSLEDLGVRSASRNRLQHFLVALGVPQSFSPVDGWESSTLDTAWRTWPSLGWMLEARNLLRGDVRSMRQARSTIGIEELLKVENDASAPESASRVRWKRLDSEMDVFGERLGEKITQFPASRLQDLQHHLGATLRGHFDDEKSWVAVNFDWLVDYKERPERHRSEMSILSEYRETLRSGVEQILGDEFVAPPVAEALLDRHDPHPDDTLADVPFCTGAIALIQRTYAVLGIRLPFANPEDLIRCGVAAFGLAQRLYERDLCLMSLAIEQHHSDN